MKYTVTLTKKVTIEIKKNPSVEKAIQLVGFYLDHDEEAEEEVKEEIPCGVHSGGEGTVTSYDWDLVAASESEKL